MAGSEAAVKRGCRGCLWGVAFLKDVGRPSYERGMAEAFEALVAAQRAGDFETAERGYRRIMHVPNAALNLSVLYWEHGRPEQAETVFRWLLGHRPDFAAAKHGLGMLLLAQRRYAEGWPVYEAGRRVIYPPTPAPEADYPEWQGEPPEGRRIVVCAEQGAGDQLMFGRYLTELAARGAQVTLACDPRTVARLFETTGVATQPFMAGHRTLAPADYWTRVGSLPAHLGASLPTPPAYLDLAVATGGGVGVVTRGNPKHSNDAHRSLPSGPAERLLSLGRDLRPEATGARDFLDTAEIVAGLDLVITVDTSVAHLAGAMGKPVWVLLPRLAMDWRWNDGVRSDWYPQARLFRQPAAGAWDAVLDAVEAAI
jgi:hypothetical protein